MDIFFRVAFLAHILIFSPAGLAAPQDVCTRGLERAALDTKFTSERKIEKWAHLQALALWHNVPLNPKHLDAAIEGYEDAYGDLTDGFQDSEKILLDQVNKSLKSLGLGLAPLEVVTSSSVFVITHPTKEIQKRLATHFQTKKSDAKKIFLLSEAYPLSNEILREKINYIYMSSSGQFTPILKTPELHLAGGAFEACLKMTFRNIVESFLWKCPDCGQIKTFFHLDMIYQDGSHDSLMQMEPETRDIMVSDFILSFVKTFPSLKVSTGENSREYVITDSAQAGKEIYVNFLER